jgi:transposase-like protein
MVTTDELLDKLMKDYKKPEDLIGENGLLKQLTKRLLERAMQAELTEHLGYEKHGTTKQEQRKLSKRWLQENLWRIWQPRSDYSPCPQFHI